MTTKDKIKLADLHNRIAFHDELSFVDEKQFNLLLKRAKDGKHLGRKNTPKGKGSSSSGSKA